MSATGKVKGKNIKAVKKWNIATIHTLPTGAKRGIPLGPAGEGNFRKCDVAFGNSCFSTGTVGFLLASVVVNSIAGGAGLMRPAALGFVGRMRGPVPLKGKNETKVVAGIEGVGAVEAVKGVKGITVSGEVPATTESSEGKEEGKGAGEEDGEGRGEEAGKGEGKGKAESEGQDCNCGGAKKASKARDVSWSDREAVISSVIAAAAASGGLEGQGLLSSTAMVDSHCHLQLDPLYSRADETIATAQGNGIQFAVVCGTCPGDDWDRIRGLYERFPSFIAPQFGLHPWWISRYFESLQAVNNEDQNTPITTLNIREDGEDDRTIGMKAEDSNNNNDKIIQENVVKVAKVVKDVKDVKDVNVVEDVELSGLTGWEQELERVLIELPSAGVGECGLDHCLKNVNMTTQIDILRRHIRVAARHHRPVTIHCVGAWGQLLEVLKESEKIDKREKKEQDERRKRLLLKQPGGSDEAEKEGEVDEENVGVRGVKEYILHSCNSLPVQMVAEFLKIPTVYFSFSGRALSTNKEGKLMAKIPLDRVLLETDSPDQLSLSLRNKLECNEPSLVRLNVQILAGIMGIDSNELASTASANAIRIFRP